MFRMSHTAILSNAEPCRCGDWRDWGIGLRGGVERKGCGLFTGDAGNRGSLCQVTALQAPVEAASASPPAPATTPVSAMPRLMLICGCHQPAGLLQAPARKGNCSWAGAAAIQCDWLRPLCIESGASRSCLLSKVDVKDLAAAIPTWLQPNWCSNVYIIYRDEKGENEWMGNSRVTLKQSSS